MNSGSPNCLRNFAKAWLAADWDKPMCRDAAETLRRWAGSHRRTEKNIGIATNRIPAEVVMMFDDLRYWLQHETYPPDKIATRLHQRLVLIHPFPNGNGRHARLMADLLIEKLGGQP